MSKRVEPNGGTDARCHPSNNKMKRFNGTIRDREKTLRGRDTAGTHVFEGIKVYHNHMRKHDSICMTPAEAAGTSTEGTGRWKTIIQNSGLCLIATDQRMPSYHGIDISEKIAISVLGFHITNWS